MRSLVHIAKGGADDRLPRQISVVVAAAGLVAALMTGMTFAAILAGMFAYSNYQALRGQPVPTFPGFGH